MLTTLEAPAPDCTETLISIHLLLSAEQKTRPELTLAQLKEELCRNAKYTIAARPLPHCTREDETKLTPIQKVKTISPVPVVINVDGVDMKFDAIVVVEGYFPQGLYLGRQELRCYNIGVQDTQGEARIDERASLVVAFGSNLQEPIPLYGMIDTGSGVSILSLAAYQKIASAHSLSLLPFERKLVRAQVITQDPNEYRFRNVMIRPSGVYNRSSFVSEDTLTSVGDDGTVYLAVRNKTAIKILQIPS